MGENDHVCDGICRLLLKDHCWLQMLKDLKVLLS